MEIKRQPLATTHLDLHGEKLTRDELYELFRTFPSEMILNDNHNLSLPPTAKATNLTFDRLNDGEWAIVADITVFDEHAYKNYGGFSISWLADTITVEPDSSPDMVVLYNPRYFSDNDAVDIASTTNKYAVINARQLKQKGVETALMLILQFITASALAGFFGKIGSDAYDALRLKLSSIVSKKRSEETDVTLQLMIPSNVSGLCAEVVIEIDHKLLPYTHLGNLDFDSAITKIKKLPYSDSLKKVVVRVQNNSLDWIIDYYIKSDGTVIKI